MNTKKPRFSKKDYIFLCAGLALGSVMLLVLLRGKPEHPSLKYWITLGSCILLMVVFILCFPGLSRLANLKTLPEKFSLWIVGGILGAFWLLTAAYTASAAIHRHIGSALLLVLVLVGITNILKDLAKHLRQRDARQNKGSL